MKKIISITKIILTMALAFGPYGISAGLAENNPTSWKALKKAVKEEAVRFKGKACFVIKDLKSGREIYWNRHTEVPSASLVKIPIMAYAFSRADEGRLDLKRLVALKSKNIVSGSGRLKNMPAGYTVSIARLIDLMIIESDNTATNTLIDALGMKNLNEYFKKIGMKNTNLSRKMMDMASRSRGVENYTTAEDMALVLEKMYNGTLENRDVSSRCLSVLKCQKMKDRIPKKLPPDTVVAHKTGLERGVCHDVGIVFTRNGDFLIAALTKHSNKKAYLSKKFISNLTLDVYDYYM